MNGHLFLPLALWRALALGQQGWWELPFDFGTPATGCTMATDLIHVWNGSTTKVLALSRTAYVQIGP